MGAEARHRVVIVGGGLRRPLRRAVLKPRPVDVTLVDRAQPPPVPATALPGRDRNPLEGEVAPPIRDVLRKHATSRSSWRGDRFDLASDGDRAPPRRPVDLRVRQPDRRRRSRRSPTSVTTSSPVRTGHEDDRRRPGAARPDLRRLRDGRARGRRRRPARLADLRRGRRRPDRRGDRRADRRAVAPRLKAQLPARSTRARHSHPRRRRGEILADLRRPALGARPRRELERLGVEHQDRDHGHRRRRLRRRRHGADGRRADRGPHEDLGGRRAASPLAGPLAEASGASATGPAGSRVSPDCTVPGHPEVFAIGDMMALDKLPGVAEVAMQRASTPPTRSSADSRQGSRAVQVPRPGQHGDDLAVPRDSELQGHPARRGSSAG